MEHNTITEFERAEYYKSRYKTRRVFTYIIGILMFLFGIEVAAFWNC